MSISPLPRALPISASLPAGFPEALGVKETVIFIVWPGMTVIGNVGETIRKWESDAAADEIVTADAVLFVIVSVMDLLLPTTTAPKSRFALDKETAPCEVEVELPPKRPWQPVMLAIEKMRKTSARRSQRELRSMCTPSVAALAFVRRESFFFRYLLPCP
jgi:hypothetical protein